MSSYDPFQTTLDERCEICGSTVLSHDIRYLLEARQDEPRELFARLAGHAACLPRGALSAGEALAYMRSVEARAAGHALLSL